ncbi:hypothetical protein CYMTET_49147 [Cymbomonas tetramitiformis]|uniref:Uncharacterized protein n=1 Tax=Cymbomonas tetramitiformis TaxID=36881 RepID=A0AAE0EUF5_9CHLO|nr:hypothetical protein CYMTET_49147 [Cymbomonas tetramitiformis]
MGKSDRAHLVITHAVCACALIAQHAILFFLHEEGSVRLHIAYARYDGDGRYARIDRARVTDLDTAILFDLYFIVSALQHCYQACRAARSNGVNHLRWSDYLLTAPVMIVVVGITVGILDVFELGAHFILMSVTIACGMLSEAYARGFAECHSHSERRIPFAVCDVAQVLLALCLGIAGDVAEITSRARIALLWAATGVAIAYMSIARWLGDITVFDRKKSRFFANVVYGLAFVPYATLWCAVIARFALAIDNSEKSVPDWIFAIVIGMFLGFTGTFPIIHILGINKVIDVDTTEFAYAIAGVANKSLLGWYMWYGAGRMKAA